MSKNTLSLEQQLEYLKLHYMREQYEKTAQQASQKSGHISIISAI